MRLMLAALSLCLLLFAVPLSVIAQDAEILPTPREMGQTSSLRPSDGSLVEWEWIGPFGLPRDGGDEFDLIDPQELLSSDAVTRGETRRLWRRVVPDNGAEMVDLEEEIGTTPESDVTYALAEIYVNRDLPAKVRLNSKGRIAIWIDGERVELRDRGRNVSEGPIRLRMGFNSVLVAMREGSGRGQWSFSAQVLAEDGTPINPRYLRILDDSIGFIERRMELIHGPAIEGIRE